MATTFYIEQTGFTAGEVSPAVGNRTDLEKFPYALAKAKNCYISPYGPVSKRQGSQYIGEAKYADRTCIFEKFIHNQMEVYLLEIGDMYIRVYYDDVLITEIETVFETDILREMRFNQSQDVVLITSGKYKPYILSRYSHTDWRLEEFTIDKHPLQPINSDEGNKISATAVMGNITLSAVKDTFNPTMVGTDIQLIHDVEEHSQTLQGSGTSGGIWCKEWRLKTTGFWKGSIQVQRSTEQSEWDTIRTYNGSEDTNIDESGVFNNAGFVRIIVNVTAGSQALTISALIIGKPHTAKGLVRITGYNSPTSITGSVIDRLGDTKATVNFRLSYWYDSCYPRVACWWQDRLWFAGASTKFATTIWGSRTSDYANFSTEDADGELTDDSACIFPLVARETFSVNWLAGGKDMLILADNVEYRVDGDITVTPKNFKADVQSSRGSNNCKYQFIGNQIIFVQQRGGTVREMGFDESQNGYIGDDLTILAKHLVEEHTFIDSCYMQEPNSLIYFVRDDGIMCCLSYIKEQKVYAWSTIETDGEYESAITIPHGYLDSLYVVVKRQVEGITKRFVEKMMPIYRRNSLYEYTMCDCLVERTNIHSNTIAGLTIFAGKTVQTVFTHESGESWLNLEVNDAGTIMFPTDIINCKIGIPYECEIVTLNVEQKIQGIGTIQGKEKQIVGVNLRVDNSQGGEIGQSQATMTRINYEDGTLVTGDIKCDVGGDRNLEGRLYVAHRDPMPFTLLSMVREVSL